MEDYQALNYNWHIPYRTIKQRTGARKIKILLWDIQPEKESNPSMKQNGRNKHNPDKAQATQKQKNHQQEHTPLQDQDEDETAYANDDTLFITQERQGNSGRS